MFDSSENVNDLFYNWQELPESTKLRHIRKLKTIGTLNKIEPKVVEFNCPIHNFPLAKVCGLGECSYYVSNPENKNCLINCLNDSKSGRLSSAAAAIALNTIVSDVNKANNISLLKIKKAAVKDKIETAYIPKYNRLHGHCINCEEYIKDELSDYRNTELTHVFEEHGWCSSTCKEAAPAWKFDIEDYFGCSYATVLAVAYSIYKNDAVVDELLGLQKGITSQHKSTDLLDI